MAHKINISGIIGWDVLASDIKKEIRALSPTDDIEIEVNSPGGSVFEGIEISNAIKSHKGKTTTIATSLTASMGSYIMMAGDIKKAHDDASFMIHNASTLSFGDHRDLRKTADVVESLSGMLSKAYARQSGKPLDEIQGLMDAETWLFGDEILASGFVDEIIQTEKPEDKEEAVAFQKLVFLDCIEKLKKEEDKNKNDINNLEAYFKGQKSTRPNQQTKEKTMEEKELLALLGKTEGALEAHQKIVLAAEKTMDFKALSLREILDSSESAKEEHDTAIEEAKTEASTEIDSTKMSIADAKFAGKILASSEYSEQTKNVGIEMFSGANDMKTFKLLVANEDMMNEKIKSLGVQQNQPDATPAGETPNERQAAIGTTKANAKILSDAINQKGQVQ